MSRSPCDVAVIGGGIVGLASALSLTRAFPRCTITVLEKEPQVGRHQTGHNSGVIHAGIYYAPGSYKARLCVEGGRQLKSLCDANGVRYENCGKVIVATDKAEVPRLNLLYERGIANGVPGLTMIAPERLRDIEPHARAVQAVYSPQTAIVDFGAVVRVLADIVSRSGAAILTGQRVHAIRRRDGLLYCETNGGTVAARNLLNCGGLHADRIARLMGHTPAVRIIPFRGEYYVLRPERRLVHGLIYPVPDPAVPFLGVHFTKRIHGEIEAGPNAVLAFAREGYSLRDVSVSDLAEMLAYRGFWAMARRYWRTGVYEFYRSVSRQAFLRALQRLVPVLEAGDMCPGGSGVRAQAVSPDGSLLDDFHILEAAHAIHVLNAPSPAATASLAIGAHIAALAGTVFDLAR